MDAIEFFQHSAGQWRSLRTTHHLAFRRTEKGESEIVVEALAADHPKVVEICQMHDVDPTSAIGGAFVRWEGSMAWDRNEDENHTGSTVFALVPEDETHRSGKLLRERGYAEVVPVVGQFHMDQEDGLILTTDYETMSSIERFWFAGPGLRLRTSTVKRFGGFSTATFCTEFRVEAAASNETEPTAEGAEYFSLLGW